MTCATAAVCVDGRIVQGWSPAVVVAEAGQWVVWRSADGLGHPVAITGATPHEVTALRSSWQAESGVYPFVCAAHPNMRGVLLVGV